MGVWGRSGGSDQCFDLSEGLASERLGLRSQAAALRVRESQTFGRELFPKDAVLFLEIGDNLALLLIDPAGHGDDAGLRRVRGTGSYRPSVAEGSRFLKRPVPTWVVLLSRALCSGC